jgi:hypothetical protein
MKIRTSLLGVAAVATLAFATPALAKHHMRSSQAQKDASEAKITAQLNEQQAANPGSTPSVDSTMATPASDTQQQKSENKATSTDYAPPASDNSMSNTPSSSSAPKSDSNSMTPQQQPNSSDTPKN